LEGKNVVTPVAAYVDELGAFCSLYDDLELMECFLTLPTMTPEQASPLDFAWMQQQQQQDETLQQRLAAHPNEYVQRQFYGSHCASYLKIN
jgi:recombinational DNA repair protein RecR